MQQNIEIDKIKNLILVVVFLLSIATVLPVLDRINESKNTIQSDQQITDEDQWTASVSERMDDQKWTKSTENAVKTQETPTLSPFQNQKTNNVNALATATVFVSKWNTTKIGSTLSNQIKLPLQFSGTYNFQVNWGDNQTNTITTWNQVEITHTYAVSGTYTVIISGMIKGWSFSNVGDKLKIIEISQWGNVSLGNTGGYFWGSANLNLTATDAPDLQGTTTMLNAFYGCINLGSTGSMNAWNVSKVTNMDSMFYGATSFNQPIGQWNVSQVTTMNTMFRDASSFNQPIGSWDVSKVTTMIGMFYYASAFNQSIDSWDVSQVTRMDAMFSFTSAFNQPIGSWDVSNVTNFYAMFWGAPSFNQPIGSWNVSKATLIHAMFYQASAFNQPIGSWDVSNKTVLDFMFAFDSSFNQSLSSWDVSKVTSMDTMFYSASSFNQPLGSWNVSCVTNMNSMFGHALSFDQPLGSWNVSKVTIMTYMFSGMRLSYQNYDNLLLGWSTLPLHSNVTFNAGDSRYSIGTISERDYIISHFNWTIVDGGQVAVPSAPQSLHGVAGNTKVNLTWSVPASDGGTPITSYNVYRSTTSGSGYSLIGSVTCTTLSYNNTGLTNGQTYYYVVKAVNQIGEGGPSTEISTTPVNLTPPSAPQNLQGEAGNVQVQLTWNPPLSDGGSTITSYNIYRSTTSGSGYAFVDYVIGSPFFVDNGVSNAQTYYYVVTAVNQIGESIYSNEVSVTPTDQTNTMTTNTTSTTPATTTTSGSTNNVQTSDLQLWTFLIGLVGLGFIARSRNRGKNT